MKPVLVLDNYDSFTYNLVHLIRALGYGRPDVRRNDRISLEEVGDYDKILLSPGPGIPSEAGIMPDLVRRYAPTKSILGVCLGHQCIAEVFGGFLENMDELCHGKGIITRVVDSEEGLFKALPAEFISGRYHSWTVRREGLPPCLAVTAIDDEGRVMALRHRTFDVRGVQFHPESVLTPHGPSMLKSWMEGA